MTQNYISLYSRLDIMKKNEEKERAETSVEDIGPDKIRIQGSQGFNILIFHQTAPLIGFKSVHLDILIDRILLT